ncbi:MAG: hypothetical protein IKE63_01680 [Bacilli bacterium]|nr:hypothetical protein [Bacilli bacterium]
MRRMDRYKDEEEKLEKNSRMDKNQELYHNLSSNAIYTNITDVTNANAFEINNNTNKDSHTTREAYQQMQKYQTVEPMPKNKKELEDFNYLYQKKENKTYDINSFLEEARKNRPEKDDLDEKRKLKNNAYNILASINKEQLEKYREEKKKRIRTPEEEELHGLTEDLLEKTFAGEIDKETTVDLLSDLMATSLLDTVAGITADTEEVEEIKEITDKLPETKLDDDDEDTKTETELVTSVTVESFSNGLDEEEVEEVKKKGKRRSEVNPKTGSFAARDQDFYTRSMDLSDKDFNLAADFDDKKVPVIVKILIFILILALLAVAAYIIYMKMS